ncbi:hypothetical protein M9458_055816 [Cirrhinus mrigala]|uniref:Uncharacterized protein n=1 Tax=Cirrhinus mrigala TaxID=683832 RepID=A0ABD0MIF3_CIRMR
MDPLASRLSVTEYSAEQGPSNFLSGRHTGMDTARLLATYKNIWLSLIFLDYALLCVGLSFTVGVAEEQRDKAVTPAAHPARKMAAAPVRAHEMAATAEPVLKMAAKTKLRHVTAAMSEPSKVAAAFPESSQVSESSQVAAAFPESSQLSESSQGAAVFPVSSKATAVSLKASKVTAERPEPLHKMAATPEPVAKMAASQASAR